MILTNELFDLSKSIAGGCLSLYESPWNALPHIGEHILQLGKSLPEELFEKRGEDIWVAKSAKIASYVTITGPCIIDEAAQVRPGAFIRGNVLVGKKAVVGNSTELKNVILFDGVQVPHYNYVGDSILGHCAHMGAGAITSNVKSDKSLVFIHEGTTDLPTGLKKCGALLGDYVEVGCNTVLNPGTVVGKNSQIYPTSCVRGVIPANHIYKNRETIVQKRSE